MKKFITATIYRVVDRITVGDLLRDRLSYMNCYFIFHADDDPLDVRDSIWLQHENKNKKLWLLAHENEMSGFACDDIDKMVGECRLAGGTE